MLVLSLVACSAATVPSALAAGTGLWVTQRDPLATSNVASLTFGAQDNLLFAPLFAGPGGFGSFGIAITPDGGHLYVTNDAGQNSLSQYAVSPSTGGLTALTPATVAVSVASTSANPEDVTVDPTGRWLYSANPFGPSLSQLRIDPTTGALTLVNEFTSSVSPALTLTFPTGVAFSPDGKSLYVTDYGASDIAEFDVDPLTGAITPKSTPTIAMPASGAAPRRIVTASIGGTDYAYVSDYVHGQIVQFTIDPTTGELTEDASVSSDGGPTGLGVDAGSTPASLYVAADSGVVDEYDINTATGALTPKASPSIAAGAGPDGLALAPDGNELYAGDSGDSNLHLYVVAADGSLSADPTNPLVSAGAGPSTPLVHALPAAPVPPPTPIGGALTQLAAPNDCLTGNLFGCNTLITPSLTADYQTVVSPDGKNVYAAAFLGVLVEFTRNPSTGALTELGCVTATVSSCAVDTAAGANNPRAITISPDGNYVYVATADNALVTFSRDPITGALTWLACLSSTDPSCATAPGLDAPYGVAVSPDGTSAYVTSGGAGAGGDSAITEFSRNPATGMLAQLPSPNDCISGSLANPAGCATDTATGMANPITVVVSPDSANVYVSAGGLGPGGDVAEFSRDPTTGALTQLSAPNDCMTSASSGIACGNTAAVGFNGEEDIALSPDGRSAYLNSFGDSAVIELTRNATTGALAQLPSPNDCVSSDPSNPGGCGTDTATALDGVQGVAVSPDGLNVYASASGNANAVDEFARNPLTGALTELASPFNCLTENGSGCPIYNVNGLGQPRRLALSPDGLNVYAAGQEGTVVELRRTPRSADLSISESGAPASATVGGSITYTYTVTNHGPSAADDPVVSVTLAGAESFNSVGSSQGSCSGTAPVRCGLGALLSGGSATVMVTVSLPAAGTATATGSVADATDVEDPNLANNLVVTSTTVNPPAPVNTVLPVVTGTARQGQPLSASQGTWSNSPTGYAYQWLRCNGSGNGCTSISGATAAGYTPLAGDVGHTLRVTVTATNAGGSTPATSVQTAVVGTPPVNTALPVVSGTAQQGQTLTTSNGSWTGTPTPTYSYQWQQCNSSGSSCTSISSAATPGYTPLAGDVGHTLRATVTASNSAGNATATSVQTAVILIAAPVNTVPPVSSGTGQQPPVISGTGQQGQPPPAAPVAPPVLRSSVVLRPVAGRVLIRVPGSSKFRLLSSAINVPLGSTIDARSGTVSLTVALPKGGSQTGRFYDGQFVLTQSANGTTIATLTGGSFAGCPAAPKSGKKKRGALITTAKKKPNTVIRQLWGNAHGNYTTKGRYGSASVSGTIWLTQDRCDGTFVRVTKDSVTVVAFAHPKKKHKIRQGHQILVPGPGY
jgi:uncharacterized repeat protein (TIGR01451 family)